LNFLDVYILFYYECNYNVDLVWHRLVLLVKMFFFTSALQAALLVKLKLFSEPFSTGRWLGPRVPKQPHSAARAPMTSPKLDELFAPRRSLTCSHLGGRGHQATSQLHATRQLYAWQHALLHCVSCQGSGSGGVVGPCPWSSCCRCALGARNMGSWLSTYVDCASLCLELVYLGLRWRATVQGFGELRQMMCMTWLCDR